MICQKPSAVRFREINCKGFCTDTPLFPSAVWEYTFTTIHWLSILWRLHYGNVLWARAARTLFQKLRPLSGGSCQFRCSIVRDKEAMRLRIKSIWQMKTSMVYFKIIDSVLKAVMKRAWFFVTSESRRVVWADSEKDQRFVASEPECRKHAVWVEPPVKLR